MTYKEGLTMVYGKCEFCLKTCECHHTAEGLLACGNCMDDIESQKER